MFGSFQRESTSRHLDRVSLSQAPKKTCQQVCQHIFSQHITHVDRRFNAAQVGRKRPITKSFQDFQTRSRQVAIPCSPNFIEIAWPPKTQKIVYMPEFYDIWGPFGTHPPKTPRILPNQWDTALTIPHPSPALLQATIGFHHRGSHLGGYGQRFGNPALTFCAFVQKNPINFGSIIIFPSKIVIFEVY